LSRLYVRQLAESGRGYCLPEVNSPQPSVRQFAERTAINAPIEGTAADLIKVAMVRIVRRLADEGLDAAMIVQVHDELVFKVPVPERDALTALVRQEMEGVLKLSVPLRVEIAAGANWDEAHT
jgi:DNA polymerase I